MIEGSDILLFANKLENIDVFAKNNIKSIVDLHKSDMLEEQKERIHIKGEDKSNDKFGFYTPFTIELKKEKNQFTDFIILQDTESFKESEFIKTSKSSFTFGATDPKYTDLKEDYGDILGMDKEMKEKYTSIFKHSLIYKIKKYL